jgi:flagellar hook assembly protein FlgD
VRTLLDGAMPAGATLLQWDGRDDQGRLVSSGVYFARATAAGGRGTTRIPVAR